MTRDELLAARAWFCTEFRGQTFVDGHPIITLGNLIDLHLDEKMVMVPIWRPVEEWNEDIDYAFWSRFPVVEPYYAGSPLCDDWVNDYYTHFIPMSVFNKFLDCDGNLKSHTATEQGE